MPAVRWREPRAPRLSIVVPVLNEAGIIGGFLRHLRERAPGAEIVVVDGGSTDGTARLARSSCDRLLVTPPGRALQLNAGAKAARGDELWFLHADSRVPAAAARRIHAALAEQGTAGGYFRINLPRERLVYRLTDTFAHYAGLLLRMRCGDHGFFCRREVFEACGGFPEVPLMEDVAFFRRLRRRGRMRTVRERLETSPRRFERMGPLRLTCAYGLLSLLYLCGLSHERLKRIYLRTCEPSIRSPITR